MLTEFLSSRTQVLSHQTIKFYKTYLNLASSVLSVRVTGQELKQFIDSLSCSNGGKHTYYRVLRPFYNWLYSPKSGLGLNAQDNPITWLDPPEVEKKILPSLSPGQLDDLISQAECLRDKAIISLFADSGLRLSELANISLTNIDWKARLTKVKVKGNKEGLAPFGSRTELLLKQWLSEYKCDDTLWGLNDRGIQTMLGRLEAKTGLKCNVHTFRRSLATILARRGVDSIHIMRLGRWEAISMVERYTRSVKFEDSLKLYSPIVS